MCRHCHGFECVLDAGEVAAVAQRAILRRGARPEDQRTQRDRAQERHGTWIFSAVGTAQKRPKVSQGSRSGRVCLAAGPPSPCFAAEGVPVRSVPVWVSGGSLPRAATAAWLFRP